MEQESRLRRSVCGGGGTQLPRLRGFTLIELMITVVVVAILAAIAYPSYQEFVRRGNRSAAQAFMMTIAQRQEQYLLTNRSYATVTATALADLNLTPPPETINRYTFAVTGTASPPSYLITATAIGSQAPDGDLGNLTLSSDGTKTPASKWKK